MAYVRIATHPSIFAAPLTPEEAVANVSALLALPHVRVSSEQDGFLDAYAHVTADVVVRGKLPRGHFWVSNEFPSDTTDQNRWG